MRVCLPDDVEGRFVLDTGAGTSGLSLACARRLALPLRPSLRVRTPMGLTAVGTLHVPWLVVGPLRVAQLRLAVVPLPDDRVDGLLGLDVFRALGAVGVTLLLHPPRVEVLLPVDEG